MQACACTCAFVCSCVCAHQCPCVFARPRTALLPGPRGCLCPSPKTPRPSSKGGRPAPRVCPPGLCPHLPAPPPAESPQLPSVLGLTPSPCTGASCGWTSSCGTWASTSAPAGRAGSRARTAATSTAPRYPAPSTLLVPAPSTPLVPAPVPAPGALWHSVLSSVGAGAAPLQTIPISVPVPVPVPVPPCGMSFIPCRPLHLLRSAALAPCPGFIVQIFQQSQRGDPAAAHPGAGGTALWGLGADGCSIPAGGPQRSRGCAHQEVPQQCPPLTSSPAGPQFGAAFVPRSWALALLGLWGDNSPPPLWETPSQSCPRAGGTSPASISGTFPPCK